MMVRGVTGAMLAAPALAALVALAALATAQPDAHVQLLGQGTLWLHGSTCETDILMVVEETSTGRWANLEFVPDCPEWWMKAAFYQSQTVYRLEGDWERGFAGTSLILRSRLSLSPYGDGSAISATGNLLPGFADPLFVIWSGTLCDARLL